MAEARDAMMRRIEQHFGHMDETVIVVLKGHLLIEEALDTIISGFVFHPEFIQSANLRFSHKLAIARAMSLDEHENEMWEIASSLNNLRNELAHSLHSPKRQAKTQTVLDLYFRLAADAPVDVCNQPEHIVLFFAIGFFLGFLTEFQKEVKRFRGFLNMMDPMVNPHRYLARIIHEGYRLARMSAEFLAFCRVTGTNPVGGG